MTQITRKGFVNKNGDKVKLDPATHEHTSYATKVEDAVGGNLAGLDENGNLTDSGKKPSDFAAANHEHYRLVGQNAGEVSVDSGEVHIDAPRGLKITVTDESGDSDVNIDVDIDVPKAERLNEILGSNGHAFENNMIFQVDIANSNGLILEAAGSADFSSGYDYDEAAKLRNSLDAILYDKSEAVCICKVVNIDNAFGTASFYYGLLSVKKERVQFYAADNYTMSVHLGSSVFSITMYVPRSVSTSDSANIIIEGVSVGDPVPFTVKSYLLDLESRVAALEDESES